MISTLTPDERPWDRLPRETAKQYIAFTHYFRLSPEKRSIRNAFKDRYGDEAFSMSRKSYWGKWCARNEWVERAMAYDSYAADLERIQWQRRRGEIKELDYQQSMKLHRLTSRYIDISFDFIKETRQVVKGKGGEADTIIIRQQIDFSNMLKAIELASKIGRLSTGESTENVAHFRGDQLDGLIHRELQKLTSGGEIAATEDFEEEEPDDEGDEGEAEYDLEIEPEILRDEPEVP